MRRTLYMVISRCQLNDLTKAVQLMLDSGWQLQGGVTVSSIKTGGNVYDYKMRTEYCQAMTKKVWALKSINR